MTYFVQLPEEEDGVASASISSPNILTLSWQITAAKTVSDQMRCGVLTLFDAVSGQAAIDSYLGTTNEFLAAAFDATAMGNDVFAGIVNMGGQCAELYQMVATCYSASNTTVTRQTAASAALTASTLVTECAKGSQGNVAFKIDFGNTPDFDALTAGTINVSLYWRSK